MGSIPLGAITESSSNLFSMVFRDKEKQKQYQAKYYQENKTKMRALHRQGYLDNRERAREYSRKPKARRDSHFSAIKCRYGLLEVDFEAMLIAQSGLCAACEIQLVDLRIDHCHKTGTVRGLLCPTCNVGVGFAEHPNLEKWHKYLQQK